MNPDPFDVQPSLEPAGLSRRAIVGASATGLALAMLARAWSQTSAQEGTPAAEGGLPPGLAIIPMIDIPVPQADVPPEGFKLSIYRVTLEAGAVVPNSTIAYPTSFYTESGVLTCPGAAPRYLVRADGSVEEVGDEDVQVNPGEGFYVPPNVLDGGRNDGTEQVSIIEVDLVPLEGMATPAT